MPAFETRAGQPTLSRSRGAEYAPQSTVMPGREVAQIQGRDSRAKYVDPILTPIATQLIVNAILGLVLVERGRNQPQVKRHPNLSTGVQIAGYAILTDTALLALSHYVGLTAATSFWLGGILTTALTFGALYFIVWRAFGNTPLGKPIKSNIQKAWREATSPRY